MNPGERFRRIITDIIPSLRTQKDAEKWIAEEIQLKPGEELQLEHYYSGKWIKREQDTNNGKSWQSVVNYGSQPTTYLIISPDEASLLSEQEKLNKKRIILSDANVKGLKIEIGVGPKLELAEMDEAEEEARMEYRKNVDLNKPIDPRPPIKMVRNQDSLFDFHNLGIPLNQASLPKLGKGLWGLEEINEGIALSTKLKPNSTTSLAYDNLSITLGNRDDASLFVKYN